MRRGHVADAAGKTLDVSGAPGLLPGLLARTKGRLAEARLSLGFDPQPLQGWCKGVKAVLAKVILRFMTRCKGRGKLASEA